MHLSAVASSAKFTQVPLSREENGALTVHMPDSRTVGSVSLVDTAHLLHDFARKLA